MESPAKSKHCRRRPVSEIEEEGETASRPRKRREGGEVGGDDDNEEGESRVGRAVTEEEVEEFYAIVRRAREARRLGGKAAREREEIWQPQFAWEDFQYHPDCNAEDVGNNKSTAAAAASAAAAAAAAAEVEVKIEKVFDLNAQPAAGLGDY